MNSEVTLRALKRLAGKETIVEETFVPVLVRWRGRYSPLEGTRYIPAKMFDDKNRQRLRTFQLETWAFGRAVPARVNMLNRYEDVNRDQLIVLSTPIPEEDVIEALEKAEQEPEVLELSKQKDALNKQIKKLEHERTDLFYRRVDILIQKTLLKLGIKLEQEHSGG